MRTVDAYADIYIQFHHYGQYAGFIFVSQVLFICSAHVSVIIYTIFKSAALRSLWQLRFLAEHRKCRHRNHVFLRWTACVCVIQRGPRGIFKRACVAYMSERCKCSIPAEWTWISHNVAHLLSLFDISTLMQEGILYSYHAELPDLWRAVLYRNKKPRYTDICM